MLPRAPSEAVAIATVVLFCSTLAANAQTLLADAGSSTLVVLVLDQSQLPVQGARVEIKLGDQVIFTASTNETGHTEFACKPGRHTISAALEGFGTAVKDFAWNEAASELWNSC